MKKLLEFVLLTLAFLAAGVAAAATVSDPADASALPGIISSR
jgi:hypothetical protein